MTKDKARLEDITAHGREGLIDDSIIITEVGKGGVYVVERAKVTWGAKVVS